MIFSPLFFAFAGAYKSASMKSLCVCVFVCNNSAVVSFDMHGPLA